MTNEGAGGETTAAGLSRVDDVLDQGGDYLLLMEGTNDISSRIGIETITSHLDEMATRAEEAGMVAVHASVIPRIPDAPVDSDNARTSALAASIRDLGDVRGRAVADVFSLFEALPDVFDNYYYYSDEPDPVGHPNSAGYTEMAGLMLETVLALLETPQSPAGATGAADRRPAPSSPSRPSPTPSSRGSNGTSATAAGRPAPNRSTSRSSMSSSHPAPTP